MNKNDDLPFGNDYEDDLEIRLIPKNRRYWFIRTFGGKLFFYYYNEGIVGITGNNISLELINKAHLNEENFKYLKTSIESVIFKDEGKSSEATKLANQLINFHTEVSEGDIVIIPSTNSDMLAFGEVTSEVQHIKSGGEDFIHNHKVEQYPTNIRNVRWLKVIHKWDLIGDMKNLFNSHIGITNADEYANFIESNLSTSFIKDDQCFSTFYINQNEDINAYELKRFLDSITTIYSELCKELGYEGNEELYIKIKVQSKGNTILIGSAIIATLLLAGYISTISNNTKFKANVADVLNIDYESSGNALDAYNKYISDRNKTKYQSDSLEMEQEKNKLLNEITKEHLLDSLQKIKNKNKIIEKEIKNLNDSIRELKVSPIESASLTSEAVNN